MRLDECCAACAPLPDIPPKSSRRVHIAGPQGCARPSTRVSFVVLSFNSSACLERCIRSLARQASGGDRDEVWVVDNGSTDGSAEIVERLGAELPDVVRPIRLERNAGTTIARNLALERASGRYVGIVDSDVEVPPGAVDALLARLEANPGCGIVAPRLIHPDGRPQLSTDVFPTVTRKLRRLVSLRRLERQQPQPDAAPPLRAVDYAISAFWLMRREVVERAGLFDTRIFYSPEDVDYCLRVWKAGYTVLYDATSFAVHRAQEISRRSVLHWATWSHVSGLLYLFWKHGYLFGRSGLYRRIGRFSH